MRCVVDTLLHSRLTLATVNIRKYYQKWDIKGISCSQNYYFPNRIARPMWRRVVDSSAHCCVLEKIRIFFLQECLSTVYKMYAQTFRLSCSYKG